MVNARWQGSCRVSGDRKGIAKMRKLTFQIGSKPQTNQCDPLFERAMESFRNALASPTPAMIPVRKIRRHPTRLEARLHTLSR